MFAFIFSLLSWKKIPHQALSFAVADLESPWGDRYWVFRRPPVTVATGHASTRTKQRQGPKQAKCLLRLFLLSLDVTFSCLFCRRVCFFLQFCTFSLFVFIATFLFLRTNTTVYCPVFLSEFDSYQHTKKNSAFDRTPRFSVIFPIDFLLLSSLHSQGIECLNWSRPLKESVSDRETDRT